MKQVGGVIHENADLAPTAHMLFSQVDMNIIHNKMSCDLEVTGKRSLVICKRSLYFRLKVYTAGICWHTVRIYSQGIYSKVYIVNIF